MFDIDTLIEIAKIGKIKLTKHSIDTSGFMFEIGSFKYYIYSGMIFSIFKYWSGKEWTNIEVKKSKIRELWNILIANNETIFLMNKSLKEELDKQQVEILQEKI